MTVRWFTHIALVAVLGFALLSPQESIAAKTLCNGELVELSADALGEKLGKLNDVLDEYVQMIGAT